MKNLLIIDGNSLLNRAYYGIRPLTTKDGIPTNAVYGFLNMIKKHADHVKADYLICTFDVKGKTFRHTQYELYKATRKGMPDDLAAQLPYAKQIAAALGFNVVECPGFEADDVIGTVCAKADLTGEIHSYIVTGDRDSLQLITDKTSVILVKTKEDILFDTEKFISEFGVTPKQYIDVKALMGDSSDNIPGVSGIGEKTAFKLIAENGSLDALYEKLPELSLTPSVKSKLENGKDAAYMSQALATISKEAPCIQSVEDLKDKGIDTSTLRELLIKLEFHAMMKRFPLDDDKKASAEADCEFAVPEPIIISAQEAIKIDGCVSIAAGDEGVYLSDGCKVYLIPSPTQADTKAALGGKKFICHNFKKLFLQLGKIYYSDDCAFDTMLAAYLLNPGQSSYPTDKLALQYFGVSDVVPSPASDAYIAAKLYPVLEKELASSDMTELLINVEIPLAEVLAEIEERGFKLDCGKLKEYARQLADLEIDLMEKIYAHAGCAFNINSPKQLSEILFEKLKLPAGKKTKSGYSTNAEVLAKLRHIHPIIVDILEYRKVEKLRGTYADTLGDMTDENGHIHTTLNQTGTATGRLSSSDPNLQNIPTRDDMGKELRKFFVAKSEDHVLIDADYSQIELRLMAELSGDENMRAAFSSGRDIHTSTASQVFRIPLDEVTPEMRMRAKAVNFGIIYGIGGFSLAQDLGISVKHASEYISNYLATYPSVDAYLKNTIAEAREKGYTTTLLGRRRPIPELSNPNKNLQAFGERVAMNSPIQGTAADVIKIAMINVSRALKDAGLDAYLILQVHDELIVESHRDCAEQAAEILKREMENAVKTSVVLSAEVGFGKSWYDAK